MSSNSEPSTVPTRRDISKTLSATKNLRAISMSLVKKLRSNKGISSVDIASELASEAISEVEGAAFVVSEDELAAVGKNIRRRLYDSLKVLESVGAIRRTRKDKTLTWVGTNHLIPLRFQAEHSTIRGSSSSNSMVIYKSVVRLRKSIADKHSKLSQLKGQARAILTLCRRNQRAPESEPLRIPLPFVIIRTPVTTDIKLEATPDADSMIFEFRGHYEIVNDSGILDRMFIVPNPTYAPHKLPALRAPTDLPTPSCPSIPDHSLHRPPEVDPFSSPKRRRVASKSPFAKFTSGSKPPLSPGAPLLQDAVTRKTSVSMSSSPLQSQSLRRSPNLTNCLSPMNRSPRTNSCTPPRKRGFPFHVDRTLDGEDLGANGKGKLLRRTYGPLQTSPSLRRESIQPASSVSPPP